MKKLLILFLLSSVCIFSNAQKHTFYFYWGWNASHYTKSNIHFKGVDYNFILKKVRAQDRPTSFGLNPYFHPGYFTIPQYNFRIGYYLKNNWDISFGIDHMKYVMQRNQIVNIKGQISDTSNLFAGNYDNQAFEITPDFLKFEHTDGLNYGHIELRKNITLLNKDRIKITGILGGGAGIVIPRTNTTLMQNQRYDQFHLSGIGTSVVGAFRVLFFKTFFVQSELKGGYINMPSIRITKNKSDIASQAFFYGQYNIVFGGKFCLGKK